jgi:hypothetical protein
VVEVREAEPDATGAFREAGEGDCAGASTMTVMRAGSSSVAGIDSISTT